MEAGEVLVPVPPATKKLILAIAVPVPNRRPQHERVGNFLPAFLQVINSLAVASFLIGQ